MTTAAKNIPRKFYRLIATADNGTELEIYHAGENGYLTRNTRTGEYNYVGTDILKRVRIKQIDY